MGFDGKPWILEPDAVIANASQLAEAFVGQDLLAYSQPNLHSYPLNAVIAFAAAHNPALPVLVEKSFAAFT